MPEQEKTLEDKCHFKIMEEEHPNKIVFKACANCDGYRFECEEYYAHRFYLRKPEVRR